MRTDLTIRHTNNQCDGKALQKNKKKKHRYNYYDVWPKRSLLSGFNGRKYCISQSWTVQQQFEIFWTNLKTVLWFFRITIWSNQTIDFRRGHLFGWTEKMLLFGSTEWCPTKQRRLTSNGLWGERLESSSHGYRRKLSRATLPDVYDAFW